MKRTMKVIPIALILVILIATATMFAVLPVWGDEAYASGSVSLSLSTMQAQGTCPDDYIEYGDWWWEGVTGTSGGIKFTDNQITINYENTAILQSVNKIKVTGTLSSSVAVGHAAVLYNNSNWPQSSGTGSTINIDRNFAKDPNTGSFTLFFTKEDLTDSTTTVTITSLEITLYYSTTEPVAITKGTGVKSVYLSTTNTATSGSASGTEFESGATVYGFAELAKGYNAKSGWTKVSGTANTEGAKYRVGSVTAGSNFNTISADKATYTISYNLNGGTHGATHPGTYQVDTNTFTISNPSKTGYTFTGWSGTGISGTSTSVSVAKGSVGNRSYTANWTANQYSITYKDQGNANFSGSHASGYPTTHTYGTATTLKSATKPGYTFGGWFTNQNCTGSATTSLGATSYTNNITLYAKWIAIPATEPTIDTQPSNYTGDYGDSGSISVVASAASGHTLSYKWYKDGVVVTNATNATFDILSTHEAGTFTYYCAVTATRNDNNQTNTVNSNGVTVTINKVDPTPIADENKPVAIENLIYTGEAITLVSAGVAEGGEVWYSLDGENFSATLPTGILTGTYTVYYMIHGDNNHNDMTNEAWHVDVTISPVDKTELANTIIEAQTYYSSIVEGYQNSAASFLDDINVAISIRDNDNKNETEVSQAIADLVQAIDVAHANVVDEIILALPNMDNIDYSDEEIVAATKIELSAAREAYEDLTNNQKLEVSHLIDLQQAEARFVDGLIGEIPETVAVTDKEYIEAVRAEYAALTEGSKSYVTELAALEAAEVNLVNAFINAIGPAEDTEGYRNRVEAARTEYDNLSTQAQKNAVDADLLKILTDAEAGIDVMDIINAIGDVEYTNESKGKIDAANEAFANLEDDQEIYVANIGKLNQANVDYNGVDAVNTTINNIGDYEYTPAFGEKLENAREEYEDLSEYQKSIFPADTLKILEDYEKAYDFMSKVDAIYPIQNDEETRNDVEAARSAYDNLTNDQIGLVDPDFVIDLENAETIVDFMDTVNEIGESEDTQDFRDAVENARDEYEALCDAEIEDLVPEDVLKVLIDDEAAIDVMDIINAIGDVEYTNESKGKIDAANEAFANLENDQKALVDNYGKLEQANTDYNKVDEASDKIKAIGDIEYTEVQKEKIADARETYNALSEYQKSIFPADTLKILVDDEKAHDAMDKIVDIGTIENTAESKGKIEEARNTFDALSDDQEALVLPEFVKALLDAEAAFNAIDKINAIGDLEYDESEKKLNEARETYNALTNDQKALIPASTLKELEDKEKAYDAMKDINAIGDVDLTDASKGLIDAAREKYDALTDAQKEFVNPEDLQTLISAEKVYEAMSKIDTIGDVEYTPESKGRIDAAREYFDTLSDLEKEAVDNKNDLFKAEQDYAKVAEEVNRVEFITDIKYDEVTKEAISIAREAYEALTVDQKGFFPESTLKELEDKEKAIQTLELITEIGGVEYTEESKGLIDRARESYDLLTDEQKALISVSDVAILTDSEQSYVKLDTSAKNTYIALLVIVCIFLGIGLLILAYFIYKINKNKKNGTNAAMSVAFLPCLLGASHYIDSPFLALYILAALLVIVAIVDIILVIKYPKISNGIKKLFSKKKDDEENNESFEEAIEEDLPPIIQTNEEILINKEELKEDQAEDEEGEEVVFVTDTKGNIFQIRFIKSFEAKLIQSSDETKAFYKELKNEILSYEGVKDRLSWHYDSHNKGRNQLLKFGMRGKTLCVYYALNIVDLKGSKYKVELCESSKYAAVPCMYRIKNDRRCEYAKELIAMVAEKFGLVKGEQKNVEYVFPYENNEALIAKGLIKELKTQVEEPAKMGSKTKQIIRATEVDAQMSDEEAKTYIEDDIDGKKHSGKKGIINIDVISANFNDGDKVNIEALWAKKLIPSSVGQVKLLAKGTLDKKLDIDLQDYSLQAVKMVVLVGGTIHRAK